MERYELLAEIDRIVKVLKEELENAARNREIALA
jgi:hypothetical protein